MNSEPRRGSRKGTQLAHPGTPGWGWVAAASEVRVPKTLARGGQGQVPAVSGKRSETAAVCPHFRGNCGLERGSDLPKVTQQAAKIE